MSVNVVGHRLVSWVTTNVGLAFPLVHLVYQPYVINQHFWRELHSGQVDRCQLANQWEMQGLGMNCLLKNVPEIVKFTMMEYDRMVWLASLLGYENMKTFTKESSGIDSSPTPLPAVGSESGLKGVAPNRASGFSSGCHEMKPSVANCPVFKA